MSEESNLIPTVLKNRIRIRDNVPENLKTLDAIKRSALWTGLNTILQSSVFRARDAFDFHLSLRIREGLVTFGALIRRGFIAIVKVIAPFRAIELLSVIDTDRLARTTKPVGCTIVDERRKVGWLHYRVLIAAVARNQLVWTMQAETAVGPYRTYLMQLTMATRR